MRLTHAERSDRIRGWWLVVALLGFLLGACSSSTPSGAPSGSTVVTGANALLMRLAVEGSDAAFERRFSADLDGGGEAGAMVFVGITGDQAVVYVCDGTSGTWFTGTVAADGAGTLPATAGEGSARLAPSADGVRVTFEGGTFGGRAATATRLDVGDGQLVRLEATAAAGGAGAEVGGIIITPAGVRGTFASSVKDGSSNTLLVRERTSCATPTVTGTPVLGDGSVRTVNVGERCLLPGIGTECGPGTTLADGTSSTIGGTCVPPTTACDPNAGADGNATSVDPGGGCVLPDPVCPSPPSTVTTIPDGSSNTINLGESCTPPVACRRPGAPTPSVGDGSTRSINPDSVGSRCNLACPSGTTSTIPDGSSNTVDLGGTCIPPATACDPNAGADGNATSVGSGGGCVLPGPTCPSATSPSTLADGTSRTIDAGSVCPRPVCPSPPSTVTTISDGSSNTINLGESCTPPVACPRPGAPTPSVGDGSTRSINPDSVGSRCNPACPSGTTSTIPDGSSNTINLGESCVPRPGCPGIGTPPVTQADGSSRTINAGGASPGCPPPGSSAPTATSTTSTTATNGTTATTAKPVGLVTVVSKTGNGLLTIRVGAAPATTTTTSSVQTCVATVAATTDVVRSLTDTAKALKTQLDLFRRQRDQVAAEAKQATGAEKDALQKKVSQLDRSITNVQKQLENVNAQIGELTRLTPPCPGKGQPTTTK